MTVDGLVSEGAGENLFLVFDGVIITPPIAASILHGITRDTVMRLAREAGIEVREQAVTREMLYLCDELFMTGTAAEVTPVRSVDRKTINGGKPGPISLQLQSAYFDLVKERVPDTRGWLDAV
jgi:branched-chain amino acid aminotransferase